MNEMKEIINELADAIIESIFKNEKLIGAVTKYSRDIYSSLVLKGFNSEEAFQLTKILINQGYMNSNK